MKRFSVELNESELQHLFATLDGHIKKVNTRKSNRPHAGAEKAAWVADLVILKEKLVKLQWDGLTEGAPTGRLSTKVDVT